MFIFFIYICTLFTQYSISLWCNFTVMCCSLCIYKWARLLIHTVGPRIESNVGQIVKIFIQILNCIKKLIKYSFYTEPKLAVCGVKLCFSFFSFVSLFVHLLQIVQSAHCLTNALCFLWLLHNKSRPLFVQF